MQMFNKLFLSLMTSLILMFFGCIITGKVVDQSGVGIDGVTVTLVGNSNMTTITKNGGKYQFGTMDNMLSEGNYTVTPLGNFTPSR